MKSIQTIDPNTANTWLQNNEAVLIDVREPGEHRAQHIPGSILIPLGTIQPEHLKQFAGKKIIIHCQLGRRGGDACRKLFQDDDSVPLYNLEGGITAWEKAQLSTVKSGKFFMPINQQVQTTAGTAVLLGVILGYFVSPAFLLLAAFFGGGLVFAGLTGTCGLAALLAKMPWNQ